ncbi:MAG: hypothetical protein ACQEP5_01535 [Actinomycetota bacterium]
MGIIENAYKRKIKVRNKRIKDTFREAEHISSILTTKLAKEVILFGSLFG